MGKKSVAGPTEPYYSTPPVIFFPEVIADFNVGRKDETLAYGLSVEGPIEGEVEIEIPATNLLVDDRANLPGPSVAGELAALVADFIRETEANRPFPFLGDGDAGTNVAAGPLDALAAALGSEDIEADFEPVRETVGDLDGFVLGMICRQVFAKTRVRIKR